jgi:pyruvate formate lyase activating enzyme
MYFCGIEKSSLVDYGEYLTCTVFTHGCNFRCPFCHNAKLVNSGPERNIDENEVLAFIEGRRRLLDAVCVSGGEPTLHPEIKPFLIRVKEMGLRVKLDTNGTNPKFLKELVSCGLVDYVAMDVKNAFDFYNPIVGLDNADVVAVKESVEFLKQNTVDYEFRTTLVEQFHSTETILKMADDLADAKRLYLQKFVDRGTCLAEGLTEVEIEKANEYKNILNNKILNVYLRGY